MESTEYIDYLRSTYGIRGGGREGVFLIFGRGERETGEGGAFGLAFNTFFAGI